MSDKPRLNDSAILQAVCIALEAEHRSRTHHDYRRMECYIQCTTCMWMRDIMKELETRQFDGMETPHEKGKMSRFESRQWKVECDGCGRRDDLGHHEGPAPTFWTTKRVDAGKGCTMVADYCPECSNKTPPPKQ